MTVEVVPNADCAVNYEADGASIASSMSCAADSNGMRNNNNILIHPLIAIKSYLFRSNLFYDLQCFAEKD